MQKILKDYIDLKKYIKDNNFINTLVVCSHSFYKSDLYKELESIDINKIYFDDFKPNPSYDSVILGIEKLNEYNCDSIMAVGGGSAIDVAKCIKLDSKKTLNFLVVPTTAGTGSEATRFSVIYKNGEKMSITDDSLIPDAVLFDTKVLKTLPDYQKKATMLDAFSHSIESLWSINSTDESKEYAKESIRLIMDNMSTYLDNNEEVFSNMFLAANLAGKAINISKTTAGHAMCYKLTTLYGISHGHAAMLINSELFPYMLEHIDKCNDNRGKDYLENIFNEIISIVKDSNYFRELLSNLDLYNVEVNIDDLDLLVDSVNTERLSNNPVKLEKEDIREIYIRLFNQTKERK